MSCLQERRSLGTHHCWLDLGLQIKVKEYIQKSENIFLHEVQLNPATTSILCQSIHSPVDTGTNDKTCYFPANYGI